MRHRQDSDGSAMNKGYTKIKAHQKDDDLVNMSKVKLLTLISDISNFVTKQNQQGIHSIITYAFKGKNEVDFDGLECYVMKRKNFQD